MRRDAKEVGVVHIAAAYDADEQRRVIGVFSKKVRAVQACYVDHQQRYQRVLAAPSWATHGRTMQTCTQNVCYRISMYRVDEMILYHE